MYKTLELKNRSADAFWSALLFMIKESKDFGSEREIAKLSPFYIDNSIKRYTRTMCC